MAGRLAQRRGHGGAAFIDVVDRSGRIQLHATRDTLGEEAFDLLTSLDLGDMIGADGFAFKTRRGELSLRVESWQLLAKSLRAPPEKFHGLEDVETRYRHRELDLIANEESRDVFVTRATVISAIRRYLDETPRGPLAREALGRLMEAQSLAEDSVAAVSSAARYLETYPGGPHALLAKRLVAQRP